MSMSVCLSVSVMSIYLELHTPIFTKFLCILTVVVARSYSDGVAICYVFPVL